MSARERSISSSTSPITKSVPILRPSRPSRASSTARLTTSSTVARRASLQPVLSHTAPKVASSIFSRPFRPIWEL
jgi:hypothetical protein